MSDVSVVITTCWRLEVNSWSYLASAQIPYLIVVETARIRIIFLMIVHSQKVVLRKSRYPLLVDFETLMFSEIRFYLI